MLLLAILVLLAFSVSASCGFSYYMLTKYPNQFYEIVSIYRKHINKFGTKILIIIGISDYSIYSLILTLIYVFWWKELTILFGGILIGYSLGVLWIGVYMWRDWKKRRYAKSGYWISDVLHDCRN